MAAVPDKAVVDRFNKLFYYSNDTWKRNRWLGVPTQQNPNDIWITQELIVEVAPDFIVETGVREGGSAVLWAMLLTQVKPQGRVITIDVDPEITDAATVPLFREHVDVLTGSSIDPAIVADVKSRTAGGRVLVILDSDHTEAHVAKELECYAPLVDVGSYLVVQDTCVNGHPVLRDYGPGPMEAVEAFLASRDDFEIDADRERLMFTMHPKGFLRRVR